MASAPSLAAVLPIIAAAPGLTEARRRDLISALRTVARATGRPLEALAADPVVLRPLLAGLTPAMVGVSSGRWRNVLSHLGAALALVRPDSLPRRLDLRPSPAWAVCLAALPEKAEARHQLARLARWCTREGVAPEAVDDALLVRFGERLTTASLCAQPTRAVRDAAKLWNWAAETCPGWPQQRLVVSDNRVRISLPWDSYPASLLRDVDAWLDRLGRDPLADRDFRPLRPTSLRNREVMLRLYLAALVQAGREPALLTSLASTVSVEAAKAALRVLWSRRGGQPSRYLQEIAGMVLSIARHWARLPAAEMEALRNLAHRLTPVPTGMVARNRIRLAALDDSSARDRFLTLPALLLQQARRAGPPTARLAQEVQSAVAIEILLMLPLRINNLRELRLGHTLHRRANGRFLVAIPAEQVKNAMPIEAELPKETGRLLDVYLERYRPLLANSDSDWLFAGREAGRCKSADGLRTQIERAMAHRAGLAVHPHLFRHAAAKLVLDDNPAAYALVQRILGHKSLQTTMNAYTGLEQKAAHRHYDELLEGRRARAGSPTLRPRGRDARRKYAQ